MRAAEGFMGTPFPITDVILVVSPVGSETRGYGGQFRGDHIRLVRYEYDQINRGVIYHEVAHYYFPGGLGLTWLVEGGAEFMVAYIKDRVGLESLEVRRPTARILVRSNCFHQGVTTISQLNERLREQPDPVRLCNYSLGAYFLHALLDTLGEEATSAALRELFLLHKSRDHRATEEEIYQAFLRNVPPGLEGEFRDLYRKRHGGPFIDP